MNNLGPITLKHIKPLRFVGVASGRGAQDRRCETGPDVLRAAGLIARFRLYGFNAAWSGTIRPSAPEGDALKVIAGICRRLARKVERIVSGGGFPIVLGGDHSCAVGTWKGMARALRPQGPLGLIWVDAHMDAHTPQTTPSGALHGMPLACLLGRGPASLTAIAEHARLDPAHLCLVGVRSFEGAEADLLRQLGVRIYFMQDIARLGLDAVMGEAIEHVRRHTAGFGVSIDLDAIDPGDAPGVGSPVAGGIDASELTAACGRLALQTAFCGIEIVEYNPQRDLHAATGGLVANLLDAMLAGQQSPHPSFGAN